MFVFQDVTCPDTNGTTSATTTMSASSYDSTMCGGDCLGMSDSQYSLLYAIYAWTHAVVVIGAGVLIDKLGIRGKLAMHHKIEVNIPLHSHCSDCRWSTTSLNL